jgi:hypothetical protein
MVLNPGNICFYRNLGGATQQGSKIAGNAKCANVKWGFLCNRVSQICEHAQELNANLLTVNRYKCGHEMDPDNDNSFA